MGLTILTIMRNFLFGICVIRLFTANLWAQDNYIAPNSDEGRAAFAAICTDSETGVKDYQLLDFYLYRDNFTVNLPDGENEFEIALKLIDKLKLYDQNRHQTYLKHLEKIQDAFDRNQVILNLRESKIYKKRNMACDHAPVIDLRKSDYNIDYLIRVNNHIWDELDKHQKAGFLLHNIVSMDYTDSAESAAEVAAKIEYFTSYLAASEFYPNGSNYYAAVLNYLDLDYTYHDYVFSQVEFYPDTSSVKLGKPKRNTDDVIRNNFGLLHSTQSSLPYIAFNGGNIMPIRAVEFFQDGSISKVHPLNIWREENVFKIKIPKSELKTNEMMVPALLESYGHLLVALNVDDSDIIISAKEDDFIVFEVVVEFPEDYNNFMLFNEKDKVIVQTLTGRKYLNSNHSVTFHRSTFYTYYDLSMKFAIFHADDGVDQLPMNVNQIDCILAQYRGMQQCFIASSGLYFDVMGHINGGEIAFTILLPHGSGNRSYYQMGYMRSEIGVVAIHFEEKLRFFQNRSLPSEEKKMSVKVFEKEIFGFMAPGLEDHQYQFQHSNIDIRLARERGVYIQIKLPAMATNLQTEGESNVQAITYNHRVLDHKNIFPKRLDQESSFKITFVEIVQRSDLMSPTGF